MKTERLDETTYILSDGDSWVRFDVEYNGELIIDSANIDGPVVLSDDERAVLAKLLNGA